MAGEGKGKAKDEAREVREGQIVKFNRRKGPPLDFIDSQDRAKITTAKAFVDALYDELIAQHGTDSDTPAPKLNEFIDHLHKVVARVRLNAALAFKESAGYYATLTAELATATKKKDDEYKGEPKKTERFEVAPIDANDRTFKERFTKLFLYVTADSQARTVSELASFTRNTRLVDLMQLSQWIRSAMAVVTAIANYPDLVPQKGRKKGPIISKLTTMAAQTLMKNIGMARTRVSTSGAESMRVRVGPRDIVLAELESHLKKPEDGNVDPLHKNVLIQGLYKRENAREMLEKLAAQIVAYNEGPEPNGYTTIHNRIAHELTIDWKAYPDKNGKADETSLRDKENKRLVDFLRDEEEVSKEDLDSIATTTWIQNLGYKPRIGTPTREVIQGAIINALNNRTPPSESTDTKKRQKKPTQKARESSSSSSQLLMSESLGASYIADTSFDESGAADWKTADNVLAQDTVKAFAAAVKTWRDNGGKKKKKKKKKKPKNTLDDLLQDEEDEDEEDADSGFSDRLQQTLMRGARLHAMVDRCDAMAYKPADGVDGSVTAMKQVAAYPTIVQDGENAYFHPDDAGYFRLYLKNALATKEETFSLAKRRRWWWAYMFTALVRNDMAGRRGPSVFSDRTYLEVAEFLEDPVAFASDERRHWTVTGPPGAGKTSFLRLMGVLYHLLGLYPLASIDDRQIPIIQMRDLIAGYEGQTPLRVAEVFIKAIGTLAPVDEAYALVPLKKGEPIAPYNQQVIDTLLKVIDDARSLMGVALVGYSAGVLDRLIRSNDGLQRRFARSLAIPEYNATQLVGVLREALVLRNRQGMADKLGNKDNKAALVNFFEFVTGLRDSVKIGTTVYTRDFYLQQRYDEPSDEYDKRVEATEAAKQWGNLFAHENASGIVDVVSRMIRNKNITADNVSVTDVIDATRMLLLQRNMIELSDEERERMAASTKKSSDAPTEDD